MLTFPGCRPSPERQAAEAAQNVSEAAATKEQAQLWQDAAGRGDAPGLERVPVVQEPIRNRQAIQQPSPPSRPVPRQPVTIPKGVIAEIRILTYPKDPFANYAGPATVIDTTGDEIRVDLGAAGTLTLLARANFNPISLAANEVVQVAYLARQDPRVPDEAIAIRTAGGAGIAHVVRGGNQAVQLDVPLFGITAFQVDKPGLPVQVSGAGFKGEDFTSGQTKTAGDATVSVVGSVPFTLNVMVWRNP